MHLFVLERIRETGLRIRILIEFRIDLILLKESTRLGFKHFSVMQLIDDSAVGVTYVA